MLNNMKVRNAVKSTIGSIADLFEAQDMAACTIAEGTEDTQIVAYDPMVYIPTLNIIAARATFLQRWNSDEEFEPDWNGTALFSIEEDGLHYSRMEQDSLTLTLHNQFRKPNILDMKCVIFDGVIDCIVPNFVSEFDEQLECEA